MSPDRGRQILVTTFVLAVCIITYSEIHDQKRMPLPSRYVSAGMVWGILGLLAAFFSPQIAAMFGVGMDLALIYQHYAGSKAASDIGKAAGKAPKPPQ